MTRERDVRIGFSGFHGRGQRHAAVLNAAVVVIEGSVCLELTCMGDSWLAYGQEALGDLDS